MPNRVWVDESPYSVSESAQPVFSVQVEGATVITSPEAKMYLKGNDVTGTNMSGSPTVSGDTITLPTIINLAGGNDYVIRVKATIDGVVDSRKLHLIVQSDHSPQV